LVDGGFINVEGGMLKAERREDGRHLIGSAGKLRMACGNGSNLAKGAATFINNLFAFWPGKPRQNGESGRQKAHRHSLSNATL
jgi:hypothetical protein